MPTFDASTNPERIPFVDVLMALCDLAQAGGVQIMLVGATARDIALAAEGHDAPLRATNDVDIAVVVADRRHVRGDSRSFNPVHRRPRFLRAEYRHIVGGDSGA
jgi:predicted nucleotidyltransferase